jgi:hypothetical protein
MNQMITMMKKGLNLKVKTCWTVKAPKNPPMMGRVHQVAHLVQVAIHPVDRPLVIQTARQAIRTAPSANQVQSFH